MPEILDVLAEEVRPFDMVDEGLRVCTMTWHYQPSVIVMTVGILRPSIEDGVAYPAWSAIQERTYQQGEMVRVIRGIPLLPVEYCHLCGSPKDEAHGLCSPGPVGL